MTKVRSLFARSKPGFRIAALADGEAEIFIYDEIGYWGIQSKQFIQELQALDAETVHVRINSPGGSVFEGLAIANAMRALAAKVITHVDALAASIASVIALAGDEVHMAENSFLMIHEAWTISIGNSAALRKDANLLDKIGGSITDAYVKKTGASVDQVNAWMAAETWFTAAEAEAEGFVDVVDTQSDAKAEFDLSIFAHAPAALARRYSAPSPRAAERALRDAGYSRAEAKTVIAAGLRALTPRDADDDATELLAAGKQLLTMFSSQ